MKGVWGRVSFALLVVASAVIVVSGGSAGPRTPDSVKVTFDAFPGPAEVSYGEYIAFRSTLKNETGTTLTKVRFRQTYPTALGELAVPIDSTCPVEPTTITRSDGKQEWICDFGSRGANAQLALTVVWQVKPLEGEANCPDCLTTNGRWTVKEGTNDVGDPNDSFPRFGKDVTATLLASGLGGGEFLRAGGYETTSASCAGSNPTGSLRTNPVLDADRNPLSTTVCLSFRLTDEQQKTDLGYVTKITESGDNPRHSDVCIADLGTNCVPGGPDEVFSDYITHIFRIADAALEHGESLTGVSHNNVPLKPCPNTDPIGCVVSVTLDDKTKIWTIIALSKSNGQWDVF